ncbi:MAG: bifunctional (p)ppGpp synthetase/guanosine-3',5'-bis(diphosphate) 3'-pyrophosphohydrolase [Clostridia bacterium]|nr:bifunctional (p)ppGpp synthetase/guanosine-3',5'-bis(diphosphate) 3'-pyrophosphohydrolase [Clostridia bacterium]
MSNRIVSLPTIDLLINEIKTYNPGCNEALIRRAYNLAESMHADQRRDSGEPYITHPLSVAVILASLSLDDTTIIAGILHDVVEDTQLTLDDIRAEFGDDLAQIIDGVTKLNKLSYRSKQEHQAENLRKMFLAMAQDVRIILVKLADRLHNMRTLDSHHSELRQKEIALETQEIFAPLAHRLGIYKIKWELEDLSLRFLEPETYFSLVDMISMKRQEREAYIESLCRELSEKLNTVGIKADIKGRPKNFYSIYNKMKKQQKDISEIYDIHAVRVIVDSVKDCYGALGIVHTLWKPIPGRFKDYIAMPKANMYQSIHTTVICPNGQPFEVQIRTWEMHRVSEYGIAAHWRYKEGTNGSGYNNDTEQRLAWLRQMVEWQQEVKDAKEFVETVKVDLFGDSVFVFSPKGDVYELPYGSNPIDFAYRVHTQVGHQCVGAKINSRIMPLDTVLKNGDIVEVLTTRGSGPSRDWIKIVKTSQAKNKIRQWFRKEGRDERVLQKGKEVLEKELQKQNLDPVPFLKSDKLLEIAKKCGYFTADDLLVAIAEGAITSIGVINKIRDDVVLSKGLIPDDTPKEKTELTVKPFSGAAGQDNGVWVKGEADVMVRIAQCCKPLPGDAIIGYITRGRGVSVHRDDCPNIIYYREQEPQRLVEVDWDKQITGLFQAGIQIIAADRERLAMEIIAAISDTKTVINAANIRVGKDKITVVDVTMEIKNLAQLEYIINKVRRVKGVMEVKRMFSEKQNQ